MQRNADDAVQNNFGLRSEKLESNLPLTVEGLFRKGKKSSFLMKREKI